MKRFTPLFYLFLLTIITSCGEKLENSLPPEKPVDSLLVVNGFDYYIDFTIDGSTYHLQNNVDHVGNGVYKEQETSCDSGNVVRFTSYFGYVSDTTRKQWIGFGLSNCISDSANAYNDSTFMVANYPMEINVMDTSIGFVHYRDADSVYWSSNLGQNGLFAQSAHSFNVTEANINYNGFAALMLKGNFSAWLYNTDGDSLLMSKADFYTNAWAL